MDCKNTTATQHKELDSSWILGNVVEIRSSHELHMENLSTHPVQRYAMISLKQT
jgi:hypothetical protein